MNNKKTLLAILLIAIIAVAAFILYRTYYSAPPTGENKKVKIAFVVPTLENPFFVDMTNAAKTKASQMQNVEVIIKASTKVEDAIGQNQIIEDLITQKVDAICVVPTNSESIIPVIQKANAANIPIINIDNKVDMKKADAAGAVISSYVGSDNFEGGKLAGQYLVEKLGGKGKVAILEGVSGNDAAIKRKAGFLEALKGSPGIEVVASQVANWNREQAFTIFQNMLKANPNLNGVFACNDEMVLGASSALEQSKIPKSKIIVVGFDAIKEAVDAVNAGKIDATVAQQAELMGGKGLELAMDIVAQKTVEKSYSTGLKVIKK
jgi:ribose transport system substrate-binding protein